MSDEHVIDVEHRIDRPLTPAKVEDGWWMRWDAERQGWVRDRPLREGEITVEWNEHRRILSEGDPSD
jgi:hypothetical protein